MKNQNCVYHPNINAIKQCEQCHISLCLDCLQIHKCDIKPTFSGNDEKKYKGLYQRFNEENEASEHKCYFHPEKSTDIICANCYKSICLDCSKYVKFYEGGWFWGHRYVLDAGYGHLCKDCYSVRNKKRILAFIFIIFVIFISFMLAIYF